MSKSLSLSLIPEFKAYHDAHATLARHGKTFNWARRFLGREASDRAARLYAFCRYLDDLADGGIHNGAAHLETIRASLANMPEAQNKDEASLGTGIYDFLDLSDEVQIAPEVVDQLLIGLQQDQQLVALEDEAELVRYAYRVAGTVGLMMCSVLGCRNPAAYPFAIDLGIAMQLTNIARDVVEDAQMGRRYLPHNWCAGLSPNDITEAVHDKKQIEAQQLVQLAQSRLLRLADRYYESGFCGLAYLPGRAHLAIAVAGRVYQEIGLRIRRKGYVFWNGRQVVNMPGKVKASFASLSLISGRLKKTPVHQTRLHQYLDGLPYVSKN